MKPTGRFKQRYVSFRLTHGGAVPPFGEAKKIVHESFLSHFGVFGVSRLAFKLMKYDEKAGGGIIRCERSLVDEAIFCMACVSQWEGRPCRMEAVSTSGTIRRI